jgi:anti-sigma factor RsiW
MSDSTSKCDRSEALYDYAFNELAAGERREMGQHLTACAACTAELDRLTLTTAALRSLPDREIPRRIAFVSDKIFETSRAARFFQSSWTGFASAGIMAAALIFTGLHRPAPEVRTVVQMAAGPDVSKQIDAAVAKAVQQVRAEDAQLTKAALTEAETKHEQEHRMLMAAWEQSLEVMQKRMGTMTSLASLEAPQNGAGQ